MTFRPVPSRRCARVAAVALSAALLALPLLTPHTAHTQPMPRSLAAVPLDDLSAFRPAADNWRIAGAVGVPDMDAQALAPAPGTGVLVNLPGPGARDNLFTRWEHGDVTLEVDFLMAPRSNSGIYLQGRYEVQLLDSWGVRHPGFSDVGGIYERWDDARPAGRQGFEGIPPRQNASRAPGLWQHLRIVFQAPRFDAAGRKTANARFVAVDLNGVRLHDNIEVTGPTRAAAYDDEQPLGPLMIQGDHGPVAFRNLRYKAYGAARVTLSDLHLQYHEGAFTSLSDLDGRPPQRAEPRDGLDWDVSGATDQLALHYSGRLHAPAEGRYHFQLALDWITGDPHFQGQPIGGGRLVVGGRQVLLHEAAGRVAEGEVHLAAGDHPFELVYFKNRNWHAPSMALYVEGPAQPMAALNKPGTLPEPQRIAPILVDPGAEPALLRSMVLHRGTKRTHAISVGDPAGVHYAYDLAQGALLYAWRGPFVDATPMWHSRGQDQLALPQGSMLTLSGAPAVAALPDADAPWPAAYAETDGYRLDGYHLDDAGRPAFTYAVGGWTVTDAVTVDGPTLVRTLTVDGGPAAGTGWVRLAAGAALAPLADGRYAVNDHSYYVAILDEGAATPRVRSRDGRQELLLPLIFHDGQARITYAIIW